MMRVVLRNTGVLGSGKAADAKLAALETLIVGHDADVVFLQEIAERAKSSGAAGVPAALGALCCSLGFKVFFLPDTGDAFSDAKAKQECSLRNGVAVLWRADRYTLQGEGFALA